MPYIEPPQFEEIDNGEDQEEGFEFIELGAEANDHELVDLENAGPLPSGW